MAKALLSAALLVLLALIACSDPAPSSVVAPTATPESEATAPADNQPEQTKPTDPTAEPTVVKTPRPTEIPTTSPVPTSIILGGPELLTVPASGASDRPTAVPTSTAVVIPTFTQVPAATATPVATAIPNPEPAPTPKEAGATWRGLTVAPENRCSPYDPDDYPYSPSVEPKIVEDLGGIYGPYTGTWFESIRETDIEHIVARSQAHDSGLCAASPETRAEFASDLLNLTLASPSVNRHQKVDKDASDWLPDQNQCWYVDRTVQVRREYRLTVDRAEVDAIDIVLGECDSTEMVVLAVGTSTTSIATPAPTPAPVATPTSDGEADALALWDENGNGRITCAEALAHGIAPVRRGHPAYQYMTDADGDGVVCE